MWSNPHIPIVDITSPVRDDISQDDRQQHQTEGEDVSRDDRQNYREVSDNRPSPIRNDQWMTSNTNSMDDNDSDSEPIVIWDDRQRDQWNTEASLSDWESNRSTPPMSFDELLLNTSMWGNAIGIDDTDYETDSEDSEVDMDDEEDENQEVGLEPLLDYHLHRNSIFNLCLRNFPATLVDRLQRHGRGQWTCDGARFQLLRPQITDEGYHPVYVYQARKSVFRPIRKSSERLQLVHRLLHANRSADQFPMTLGDELDWELKVRFVDNSLYISNQVNKVTIWSPRDIYIKVVVRYGVGTVLDVRKGMNQLCLCNISTPGTVRKKLVQPGMTYIRLETLDDSVTADNGVELVDKPGEKEVFIHYSSKPDTASACKVQELQQLCVDILSQVPTQVVTAQAKYFRTQGKKYWKDHMFISPHRLTPCLLYLGGDNRKVRWGSRYSKYPLCGSLCDKADIGQGKNQSVDPRCRKNASRNCESLFNRPRASHIGLKYTGTSVCHTLSPAWMRGTQFPTKAHLFWPH